MENEIKRLHKRAFLLRCEAKIILFLIVTIIGFGVYVFREAGSIATSDLERDESEVKAKLIIHFDKLKNPNEDKGQVAIMERLHQKGADLVGLEFSNIYLSGVNLTEADLSECNFSESKMVGSVLQNATLYAANFSGANLNNADLRNTIMIGNNLEKTTLCWADLRGADIIKSTWKDANLYGADLRRANLSDAYRLTKEQILSACVDETTVLPNHLEGFDHVSSCKELQVHRDSLEIPNSQKAKDDIPTKIQNRNEKSTIFVIQTNITRFGTLLIIIFVVNLLMNLYRYSMRLSGFYEARADTLKLLGKEIDLEKLKDISNVMTPNYNFGKVPASPIEPLVDVIKTKTRKSVTF